MTAFAEHFVGAVVSYRCIAVTSPPHPVPLEAGRRLFAKHHLSNSWSAELAQSKAPKKSAGLSQTRRPHSAYPFKPT
nr:hypothetical protein [uncultured Acidovorax sp.]